MRRQIFKTNNLLLKQSVVLFLACLSSVKSHSQLWTWVNGISKVNLPATYGSPDTAASPGSRGGSYIGQTATDLYLFGGSGYASGIFATVGDTWKYNLSSGQWSPLKGTNRSNPYGVYGTKGLEAAANNPGGRAEGGSFTDSSGNLWIFGGRGSMESATGLCNDMWRFNTSTNMWAWMHGDKIPNQEPVYGVKGMPAPANNPGGNNSFCHTTDADGNFWIFVRNELWKFYPSMNQWAWMSGGPGTSIYSAYGTRGVPSVNNHPGQRFHSSCWFDNNGNFWMFGGAGADVTQTNSGILNELWKYNTATEEWAWVGGDNTINAWGNNGVKYVPSPLNYPAARRGAAYFKDSVGRFYVFGGTAPHVNIGTSYSYDLWRYEPQTNKWLWLCGDDNLTDSSNFGKQGVASFSNIPGGRANAVGWYVDGIYWMFGGNGWGRNSFNTFEAVGQLSDLWKLDIFNGIYVFNGNGSWEASANWVGFLQPPAVLPKGYMVAVQPAAAGGSCKLNTPFTMLQGAALNIEKGKKFATNGQLIIR